MPKYIDIVDSDSSAEFPRGSSLEITGNGLTVIGNLPHGYKFMPTDSVERDKFVCYLQSLEFEPNCYTSPDDIDLSPETAKQYRADRQADDIDLNEVK